MSDELLRVENLCKAFPLGGGFLEGKKRWLKAVDRVSLHLEKGETLGLVGESGSGKSTVGNLILRLLDADSGSVRFEGVDVTRLSGAELTRARARMQVVFQDPQSSLDPRMTVGNIVSLPLKILGLARGGELRERAAASLAEVGLGPECLDRYPHEFSGGQRQRIGLARALVADPAFVVMDEPTSALDVSVQAQILNLMGDLQARRGHAYLFISHDLTVVRHVSRRIAVIRMNMMNKTKKALQDAGVVAFFAHEAFGRGKGLVDVKPLEGARKGIEEAVAVLGEKGKLYPKRMLTVVVTDDLVPEVVKVITDTNKTGQPGDGKIFVLPLTDAVRVRTGEKGSKSIE